jgi:hypothetical protein
VGVLLVLVQVRGQARRLLEQALVLRLLEQARELVLEQLWEEQWRHRNQQLL